MNQNRLWTTVLVALGLALMPGIARAQIFTPTFMSPTAGPGIGAYLSSLSRGDLGVEGILRTNRPGFDLGLRGGVVDVGSTALTVGLELRNPIYAGTAPLQLAFTAGGQGVFGDGTWLGGQVGLSVGGTFSAGNLRLTPYIHPRLAIIDYGGGASAKSHVLAEGGADLAFTTGLTAHFAFSLDDVGPDWGIGLSWK